MPINIIQDVKELFEDYIYMVTITPKEFKKYNRKKKSMQRKSY